MNRDDVKARYIEAAETERQLPRERERPSSSSGFWPAVLLTDEDIRGWGGARYEEERQAFWHGLRNRPTAEQVSRWEEVHRWTVEIIDIDVDRMAIWAWAFSKVGGRSFSKWCRLSMPHKGKASFSRERGEYRRDRAIERICAHFGNDGVLLESDARIGGSQERNFSGISESNMDEVTPALWRAPDAKPSDLLQTVEDAEMFAAHLAEVNEARRRRSEMIRRAKLRAETE